VSTMLTVRCAFPPRPTIDIRVTLQFRLRDRLRFLTAGKAHVTVTLHGLARAFDGRTPAPASQR